MKQVRCAIYTRKSSDEGLEQSFNSLDAQREACAAYVLSQASEGWSAVADTYDDGGLSGGSLERPALQRLLSDIEAGKIDIVVVYKVDRLTRSLLDFAKLVEAFDGAGVSFVSVTQSFNTTTSMGRLTLNMLLSFAQFEREVTAERIRDKITASKAKGMWMGGMPPLGYEPDGRSLKIVPAHAALVERIYQRYLALGNVRLVAEELAQDQVVSPERVLGSGRKIGGVPLSRGQLYAMLKSPIYVGDIPHKGAVHPGQHAPLIDRWMWEQVQATLNEHVKGDRKGERTTTTSLLAGKIFDAADAPLVASHTCKGARRYRYYVSPPEAPGPPVRVPALEIEAAVAACLAARLGDPMELCATGRLEVDPDRLAVFASKAAELTTRLDKRERPLLRTLVDRVEIHEAHLDIACNLAALASELGARPAVSSTLSFSFDMRLQRSGRAVRLVQSSGATLDASPSASLTRLFVKARRWWAALRVGDTDVTRLAAAEGVTSSYLTRVVRLAFLSPAIVEAALAGTLRAEVDAELLTATGSIVGCWQQQANLLLPGLKGDNRRHDPKESW